MKIPDKAFLDKLFLERQALTFDPSNPPELNDLIEQRRINFMKRLSELVDAYEFKCKNHDWYYTYSDDHSFWMAGKAAIKEIIILGHALDDLGQGHLRRKIFKKYCPWANQEDQE